MEKDVIKTTVVTGPINFSGELGEKVTLKDIDYEVEEVHTVNIFDAILMAGGEKEPPFVPPKLPKIVYFRKKNAIDDDCHEAWALILNPIG